MFKPGTLALRGLLTDTLPYEVPIIFSNDKLHATLSITTDSAIAKELDRLFKARKEPFTIPYNYSIRKAGGGQTILSVAHPLQQIEMAEFLEAHQSSFLNFCGDGRYSLRRPLGVSSPYAEGDIVDDDARHKSGSVQKLAKAGEQDVSHLSSYFAYGPYTLLGRFVGSVEFLQLEARFKVLRQIDVSKCFYHIYTHSVSWATKTKTYAKENRGAYSFEAELDGLMQRSNYHETNGILVGPEFSRVFAEIVFQAIDRAVSDELEVDQLLPSTDYEIRRYVDDFFIFAHSPVTLDRIEAILRRVLSTYKLYVNDKKVVTHERPFVSNITQARNDISREISALYAILSDIDSNRADRVATFKIRQFKSGVRSLRLLMKRNTVDFGNVSGWLVLKLRKLTASVIRISEEREEEIDRRRVLELVVALLESVLYICAVDLRVRTTYSLAQLLLLFRKARDKLPVEVVELINGVLARQLFSMLDVAAPHGRADAIVNDSVELYNLLIIGAEFIGEDFLRAETVNRVISLLEKKGSLTYFCYISLKFCFLKLPSVFGASLNNLNQRAEADVRSKRDLLFQDSQTFLMFSDLISDKTIPKAVRRELYRFCLGGTVSNNLVEDIADLVGHSDWDGLSVEHLLRRKELRPVYAWG